MLNDDIAIARVSSKIARASWEANDADDVSWFFRNGVHRWGPTYPEDAARDVIFEMEDSETVCLDIHDFSDEDTAQESIYDDPNIRPYLTWNGIDGTEKYRIYHQEYGEAETLILEIQGRDAPEYEIQILAALNGQGGVWHFFRVESVDEYGNESTRQSWRFWVYSPPAPVSAVTAANGSGAGLFDITITE